MSKPRAYTMEETRAAFLTRVWDLIDYWDRITEAKTPRDKLEGLAFSLLAEIDGASTEIPGFVLAPNPHPDDRAYHKAQGENWYPAAPAAKCDIAGGLHEHFHKFKR